MKSKKANYINDINQLGSILMTLRDVCPEAPQFDSPSVRVKFIQYHVAKLKDAGFWDLACPEGTPPTDTLYPFNR